MKKIRYNGIDIIRVLAMCGIVGLHILTKCNIDMTNNYSFFQLLIILFKSSVNLFALITGFLYCKRNIHYKNIINIIFIIAFYCIGFTVIFSFLKPNYFNNKIEYIKALIPVIDGRYWYPVSYILLFFLNPFINVIINKLDKKDLECMIKIFEYPQTTG